MSRLRALHALLAVAVMATSVSAQRPGQPTYWAPGARDYANNVTATDSAHWVQGVSLLSAHPNPESSVGKVVYVKGQSPQLQWTFVSTASLPIPGQITFSNFRIEFPNGTTYPLAVSPATQSVTIGAFPSSQTLTLSLGSLPSYVALGTIKGTVTAVSTQHVYWPNLQLFIPSGYQLMSVTGSFDRIYITDQTPNGLQSMPWTDLLESACSWAFGKTGAANCAEAVTNGLFYSGRWTYSSYSVSYVKVPSPPNPWYQGPFGYNLRKALTDPNVLSMDCKDVAGFSWLALQSLGHSSNATMLWPSLPHQSFLTNPICGIGSDSSDFSSYVSFIFGHHAIVEVGFGVYDGSAAQWVDLNGNGYSNPPAGWMLSGYWRTAGGSITSLWPFPNYGLNFTSDIPYDTLSLDITYLTDAP